MLSDRLRYVQPAFNRSGKDWQLRARGSPESIDFLSPLIFPATEKDSPWEGIWVLFAVRAGLKGLHALQVLCTHSEIVYLHENGFGNGWEWSLDKLEMTFQKDDKRGVA